MSFISRLSLRFPNGFSQTPIYLTPKPVWSSRTFSLPAKQEGEEEKLEMIDQRKLPADYDPSNFDPTQHRSPPTDRVWRLVDEISGLKLMEITQLSKIMMKKLGMKEPPVVGAIKPGAAPGLGRMASKGGASVVEEKEEKTAFEVKLEAYEAASKIRIIKEVRSFTDLGLKEAKELVEKAPSVIKSGVTKEEAEKIIEKLKALGAKVVME